MKDRYIHYEKAGDQFVGRCSTGLSSLSKDFATSPVYWDYEGAPDGLSVQIDATIENNFAKIDEVEGKTFDLVRFFCASICFHYDTLDTYMNHEHRMNSSPLVIAAVQANNQKHATVQFPWNTTEYIPYFTYIPPCYDADGVAESQA